MIARDHTVLDGYARLELARKQGRPTLLCFAECELTEAEGLLWLLQMHRRSNGLNAFSRILLALELEPEFKEKARTNQRFGGHNKGSSKLTEVERLDVRSEIAAAAGVGVANVTKVKQLLATARPELLQELRNGEIRIHRAWQWSKTSPEEQREALWRYQSERGIRRTIRNLVSRLGPKGLPTVPDASDLIRLLPALQSGRLGSVRVVSINVPGKAVFVTEELFRTLAAHQEELALTCSTNNR